MNLVIKDGYITAVPPCFTAQKGRALSRVPTYSRPDNVSLRRRKLLPEKLSGFAAPSVTHYDRLHCGPALSTPDSLDAHGSLYFHFSGLKSYLIVGSYLTPIFWDCQEWAGEIFSIFHTRTIAQF